MSASAKTQFHNQFRNGINRYKLFAVIAMLLPAFAMAATSIKEYSLFSPNHPVSAAALPALPAAVPTSQTLDNIQLAQAASMDICNAMNQRWFSFPPCSPCDPATEGSYYDNGCVMTCPDGTTQKTDPHNTGGTFCESTAAATPESCAANGGRVLLPGATECSACANGQVRNPEATGCVAINVNSCLALYRALVGNVCQGCASNNTPIVQGSGSLCVSASATNCPHTGRFFNSATSDCAECTSGQVPNSAGTGCEAPSVASCNRRGQRFDSASSSCVACASNQIISGNSCQTCTGGRVPNREGTACHQTPENCAKTSQIVDPTDNTACTSCGTGREFNSATNACNFTQAFCNGRNQMRDSTNACVQCPVGQGYTATNTCTACSNTQMRTANGGGFICEACPAGMEATADRSSCVATAASCNTNNQVLLAGQSSCFTCPTSRSTRSGNVCNSTHAGANRHLLCEDSRGVGSETITGVTNSNYSRSGTNIVFNNVTYDCSGTAAPVPITRNSSCSNTDTGLTTDADGEVTDCRVPTATQCSALTPSRVARNQQCEECSATEEVVSNACVPTQAHCNGQNQMRDSNNACVQCPANQGYDGGNSNTCSACSGAETRTANGGGFICEAATPVTCPDANEERDPATNTCIPTQASCNNQNQIRNSSNQCVNCPNGQGYDGTNTNTCSACSNTQMRSANGGGFICEACGNNMESTADRTSCIPTQASCNNQNQIRNSSNQCVNCPNRQGYDGTNTNTCSACSNTQMRSASGGGFICEACPAGLEAAADGNSCVATAASCNTNNQVLLAGQSSCFTCPTSRSTRSGNVCNSTHAGANRHLLCEDSRGVGSETITGVTNSNYSRSGTNIVFNNVTYDCSGTAAPVPTTTRNSSCSNTDTGLTTDADGEVTDCRVPTATQCGALTPARVLYNNACALPSMASCNANNQIFDNNMCKSCSGATPTRVGNICTSCPTGQVPDGSGGCEAITAQYCHNNNQILVGNACQSCPTGSTFDSTDMRCESTHSGPYRHLICEDSEDGFGDSPVWLPTPFTVDNTNRTLVYNNVTYDCSGTAAPRPTTRSANCTIDNFASALEDTVENVRLRWETLSARTNIFATRDGVATDCRVPRATQCANLSPPRVLRNMQCEECGANEEVVSNACVPTQAHCNGQNQRRVSNQCVQCPANEGYSGGSTNTCRTCNAGTEVRTANGGGFICQAATPVNCPDVNEERDPATNTCIPTQASCNNQNQMRDSNNACVDCPVGQGYTATNTCTACTNTQMRTANGGGFICEACPVGMEATADRSSCVVTAASCNRNSQVLLAGQSSCFTCPTSRSTRSGNVCESTHSGPNRHLLCEDSRGVGSETITGVTNSNYSRSGTNIVFNNVTYDCSGTAAPVPTTRNANCGNADRGLTTNADGEVTDCRIPTMAQCVALSPPRVLHNNQCAVPSMSTCNANNLLFENGRCENCRTGHGFDSATNTCVACPSGYVRGIDNLCRQDQQTCNNNNRVLIGNVCRYCTGDTPVRNGNVCESTQQICNGKNQILSANKQCQACPSNMPVVNPYKNVCESTTEICMRSNQVLVGGQCANCPAGLSAVNGSCVATQASCNANNQVYENGNCVPCASTVSNNACTPNQAVCNANNQIFDSNSNSCVSCPVNQRVNGNVCETTELSCNLNNQIYENGSCRFCAFNQQRNGNVCESLPPIENDDHKIIENAGRGVLAAGVAALGYHFFSQTFIGGVFFPYTYSISPIAHYSYDDGFTSYRVGARYEWSIENLSAFSQVSRSQNNSILFFSSGVDYSGDFWKASLRNYERGDNYTSEISLSADTKLGIWQVSPYYRIRYDVDLQNVTSELTHSFNVGGSWQGDHWQIRPSISFFGNNLSELNASKNARLEVQYNF